MKKPQLIIPLIAVVIILLSFSKSSIVFNNWRELYSKPQEMWPVPVIDSTVVWEPLQAIEWDTKYYEYDDDPLIYLGKLLFFDPKLSKSKQISCSSCHDPEHSWGDGRAVSLGHDHLLGTRNTPSLLNIGSSKVLNWDGVATSLKEQVVGPITTAHEMAMDTSLLEDRLGKIKDYPELFKKAFGSSKINFTRIATALSSFQETIKSRPSRFDAFMKGETDELTDQEIFGLHLFRTKARCMNCHSGKYFTDYSFHNIGLTYYKRELEDLGRYNVTGKKEDVGKFKTPSLRNVATNAPWMHNGVFTDLSGILMIYNNGMHMLDPSMEEKAKDSLFPYTDKLLKPLNLTNKEVDAVVAFMKSLSGHGYVMPRPEIPR